MLIYQEILQSITLRKGRKDVMVIMLDVEKAFDQLEWSFILETLRIARVPENLTQTILKCFRGVL